MLSAAAVAAGKHNPPEISNATVWIYSELLPNGYLQEAQASAITFAISFINAAELPAEIISKVLDNTRMLVEQVRKMSEFA